MELTQAQRATLVAHIRASTDPAVIAALGGGAVGRNDTELCRLYNLPASPDFYCWRLMVEKSEVGVAVNYVAVEAMTDANRNRITTFYTMNPISFDPSRSDIRSYWANTFSGALGGQGAATRDALEALWRATASVAEKIFATGTGSFSTPATFGPTGTITIDVMGRAFAENP